MAQTGHTSPAGSVAFSPDGRTALSGSADHTLRLWELASGREIRSFIGHTERIFSIAFSPDGKSVLSGSEDKSLRLWEVASGRELQTLKGHTASVYSVAFSPNGNAAVSGSEDHTLRLWDLVNGRELKVLRGHTLRITSFAFSPDGKSALSGSADETLRLWNLASGSELRSFRGHTSIVDSVAFSPDGNTALSGSADKTLRLWNLASGHEIKALRGHTDRVSSVAFSPDGSTALSGSFDNSVRIWDVLSGRDLRRLTGHTDRVLSVAISPDGKSVLSASLDNSVRVWNLANAQQTGALSGKGDLVTSLAISTDGRRALTGSADNILRTWDLAINQDPKTLSGHTEWVRSVASSPDGKTVLSASDDHSLRLWDFASGRTLKELKAHTSKVNSVAFSPDGKTVLSGSDDQTLRLWDQASGRELMILRGHKGAVMSVALSPDGNTALSGGGDNTLRIWEIASGRELKALLGATNPVTSVAFSPDGKTALSGEMFEGKLRVWDIASGRELMALSGHNSSVWSVAFSPDGKTALSGGSDNAVRLWDLTSASELRTFAGHAREVTSVAFSPDGQFIFSGSSDTKTNIWRVGDGAELASLVGFTDGTWAVTEPGGRYDSSNNGENPNLHWVVGMTPIGIEQLKERYFDPGLLAKIMGFNKEPLRTVPAFDSAAVKLPPSVTLSLLGTRSQATVQAQITDEGGGIGRVRVRLNGKELLADARSLSTGATNAPPSASDKAKPLALTIPVPTALLSPGSNSLDVMAFNADNHIQSRLVTLPLTGPEATARGTVPVQINEPTEPPTLHVIASGVSQYAAPGKRLDLTFAGKDAADLSKSLLVGGQRLFGVGRVQVHLLTDAPSAALADLTLAQSGSGNTVHQGAPSRSALEAAFSSVAKQAKPSDILAVFLAGHGVMSAANELDTGDYHYLTREAQSTDLSDPTVRKLWSVSSAELTEWTKAIKANKQVLVLDTCAAGGALEKLIAQRSLPGSHTIALERLKDRTGFHILAGAAADQVSYEASRYGQGLLTYALLSGLRGAALRDGEYADISTLFQYAVDEVPKLAKGVGGIQRPLIASPRGSSFDIGRLTGEDKKQVPLAQVRPLIVRAEIQSEDFKDTLRLQARLNAHLRDQNQTTARGALMFVDADEHPDGWKLRARYRKHGDGYLLEGVLFQGEQERGNVKVDLPSAEAGQVEKLMKTLKTELKE